MKRRSPPFWKSIPLFRILLPFILGLLSQEYLSIKAPAIFIGIGVAFTTWIFVLLKDPSWHYRHPYTKGLLIHIALFFSGALLLNQHQWKDQPSWFGNHLTDSTLILVELEEPLTIKPNSYGGKATVLACYDNHRWQEKKGKLLLYFHKDNTALGLVYGSRLILRKKPVPIRSSGNPGSFDFAAYCARQQYFHQVYLTNEDYKLLKETGGTFFFRQVYKLRAHMLSLMREYIRGKEELGLAEALVIGFKDDLDKDLVQSYSATGTVHVIAISGLHLGLIYWLLDLLFGLFSIPKNFRWLQAFFILSGLWGFAFLAGGGPSVLRSALMFSCMLLSKLMLRHSSTFNSLGVSAFILLVYNPYWLWDTGFQLSFAAVLSILCYQQSISELVKIRNKWMEKIWSASAVTLAAQIITLPFCLYYFHQFPVYFLFTNLIAVPLSSAILLASLFLLVLGPIPILAVPWGELVKGSLSFMNSFIRFMERLPFGSFKPILIDLWQAYLLALLILFITLAFKYRKKVFAWTALVTMGGLLTLRLCSFEKTARQNWFVIYHIKGSSLLEKIEGNCSVQLAIPGKTPMPVAQNDPAVATGILFRYSSLNRQYVTDSPWVAVTIGNKRLLVLKGDVRKCKLKICEKAQWLWVTGSSRSFPEKVLEQIQIGTVILDGSNSKMNITKWEKVCHSRGVRFYSTEVQGAFVMPLQ